MMHVYWLFLLKLKPQNKSPICWNTITCCMCLIKSDVALMLLVLKHIDNLLKSNDLTCWCHSLNAGKLELPEFWLSLLWAHG